MKTKYAGFIYSIAVVLLALVVADTYLWISITIQFETFEQCKQVYLEHFPVPIRNAFTLTVISIVLSSVSLFIFIKAIEAKYLKLTSVFLAAVTGLLSFLHVFSLM